MSEHVSIETARKLAAAGLLRAQWAVGDWFVYVPINKAKPKARMVDRLAIGAAVWSRGRLYPTDADRLVWLPRADQLLEELAQRKAPYTLRCIALPDNRWDWMLRVTDWIRGDGFDLAEAAAAALLVVLQGAVQP